MNSKTKLLILLMGLLLPLMASAQEGVQSSLGRRWCLELGYSCSFLQDKLPQFNRNKVGFDFHFGGRYRIGQTPFDVGLLFSINALPRKNRINFDDELLDANFQPIGRISGYKEDEVSFVSGNFMTTFDYNKRLGRRCEAFVGAGIGICRYNNGKKCEATGIDSYGTVLYEHHGGTSLSLMPRVGVLLFNHLRLTVGYKFQEKANRHAFVSISMVGFFGNHSTTTIE